MLLNLFLTRRSRCINLEAFTYKHEGNYLGLLWLTLTDLLGNDSPESQGCDLTSREQEFASIEAVDAYPESTTHSAHGTYKAKHYLRAD